MNKIVAIALPGMLLASTAFAGSPAAPVMEPQVEPVAPVAIIVPVTPDWTGFYAGAQVGYGDFDADNGSNKVSTNGATYGLHVGYNYDFGNQFVLGGELSYDWADISGGGVDIDNATTAKLKAGYAVGQSLLYATGGYSWADAKWGGTDYSGDGWVAGVGVDYLLNPSWIVGAEVLYRDYSDFDGTGVDLTGTSLALKASYKF